MGPEWWEDLPEEWTSQDVADMADLLGFACRAMADEHLMEFTPTEMADWVGLTEAGGYDTLVSVALDKTMRAGLRDIVQEVGPLGSNTPLDIDLEELLEVWLDQMEWTRPSSAASATAVPSTLPDDCP